MQSPICTLNSACLLNCPPAPLWRAAGRDAPTAPPVLRTYRDRRRGRPRPPVRSRRSCRARPRAAARARRCGRPRRPGRPPRRRGRGPENHSINSGNHWVNSPIHKIHSNTFGTLNQAMAPSADRALSVGWVNWKPASERGDDLYGGVIAGARVRIVQQAATLLLLPVLQIPPPRRAAGASIAQVQNEREGRRGERWLP